MHRSPIFIHFHESAYPIQILRYVLAKLCARAYIAKWLLWIIEYLSINIIYVAYMVKVTMKMELTCVCVCVCAVMRTYERKLQTRLNPTNKNAIPEIKYLRFFRQIKRIHTMKLTTAALITEITATTPWL